MRLPETRLSPTTIELGLAYRSWGQTGRSKGRNQGYNDCGQGMHARPLVVIWLSLPRFL